jgi:sialate O-acetylesterase
MYHAATADILPDGRLRITAEGVNQPRYIRYAWQPFTRANLINSDSLPASTFTLQVPE